MRKHITYISILLLMLSASFVLPKAIWHDCSGHDHEAEHSDHPGGTEGLTDAGKSCLICDFEFTTVDVAKSFAIWTPSFLQHPFLSTEYKAPESYLDLKFHQRGPPYRFEA